MFLGEEQERIPLWGERFVLGPFGGYTQSYRAGTTTLTLHVYRCEACGREARVIGVATEPFYCHCQRLIGIGPATPTAG